MSQLFARVFLSTLESSIAEDFTLRHVFEDFLKLVDYRTGTVDMTRESIARRLNVPLDKLNDAIDKLESPDPGSRNHNHEGRRLLRLDEHRNWGWEIANWAHYEEIRNRADATLQQKARRAAKAAAAKAGPAIPGDATAIPKQPAPPEGELPEPVVKVKEPPTPSSLEEVKLRAAEIGMAVAEAEKFWFHYESNGWKQGPGKPIKKWIMALKKWNANVSVFAPLKSPPVKGFTGY